MLGMAASVAQAKARNQRCLQQDTMLGDATLRPQQDSKQTIDLVLLLKAMLIVLKEVNTVDQEAYLSWPPGIDGIDSLNHSSYKST